MGELLWQMTERLEPKLREGLLADCERVLLRKLSETPPSPFHCITSLEISNDFESVASYFLTFYKSAVSKIAVRAIYTEMNGFSFNTDRWFCNIFAYEQIGGHDDYDWLSNWQYDDSPNGVTIHGFEELQAAFENDRLTEEQFDDASDLAELLVVVKFQRFVDKIANRLPELTCPVFSTAHDFDFVAESPSPNKAQ